MGAYEYNGGAPPRTTPTPTPVPPSTPTPTPSSSVTPNPTPTPVPTATPIPTPAPILGLVFNATEGLVTAPFTKNGDNTVSQSVQTVDPAQGGKAVYNFNVDTAGDYAVVANVNAPNAGSNSFFVNIDGDPTAPVMIWDIPGTSGLAQRSVGWRGDGTDTVSQFAPKVFTLSPGLHQLVIVGREAGTKIQQISVVKTPAPPSNLRPAG